MIDRLDEVFLRRSALEARALRGLLHCTKLFTTPEVRVKVFLRDDMLEQILLFGYRIYGSDAYYCKTGRYSSMARRSDSHNAREKALC